MHILNAKQESLLSAERNLLNDLRTILVRFGAAQTDHETLAQSIQQLDELFLLVVVGEFNSGKSAFNCATFSATTSGLFVSGSLAVSFFIAMVISPNLRPSASSADNLLTIVHVSQTSRPPAA